MDFLYGFVRGYGDEVDGEHHAPGQAHKLHNHFVRNEVGVFAEEQHTAKLIVHLKIAALDGKAHGADIIAEAVTVAHGVAEVEADARLIRAEEATNNLKAISRIKPLTAGA